MELLQKNPNIINFINSVIQDQNLGEKYQIIDVATNNKGEGYMGRIFMVTVKNIEHQNHLYFVIKAAFSEEKIRKIAPIRKCFENEIYFYSEIYPSFLDFNESKADYHLVPKCFKVCLDNRKEMLCLENMRKLGFEVFDKKQTFDHDHICMIFETYGRFHAYSFAMQNLQPEKYKRMISKINNIYAHFLNDEKQHFANHLKDYVKLVSSCLEVGTDDNIIKEFEKYFDNGVVDIFKKTTTEIPEFSAILHGDCWSNNMMFKYQKSDDNKKLIKMCLLDLQIIRVGSPVCDLSHCFYSGASKEAFEKLEDYLKIYHKSLSTFLTSLETDSKELFSFEDLKEQWKIYAKFGMIIAFMIIKTKLTKMEDLLDLTDNIDGDKMGEKLMQMKFDKKIYQRRIKDILYHMNEIGAL